MKLVFDNKFDSIVVVGDIHGEIKSLVFKITQQYNIKNSLIIVAGDVGLGFEKDNRYLELFKRMATKLKKTGNTLLFVRGNHDRKDMWLDDPIYKKYWQTGNSNIRLIKDYTVITAETDRGIANILCVGGAISVDRVARTLNNNYWLNEVFVYDEDLVKDLVGITHVITHSAPDFCEPTTKVGIEEWISLEGKNGTLGEDCDKERADHTLLYNKLKEKNTINKWCYGHYHWSKFDEFDGTLFKLLDIMELYEIW